MLLRKRRFDIRFDGESADVAGVAIRFGDVATLPWGRERIEPGALDFEDVILNLQHDRSMPLARTGGGGMEVSQNEENLSLRAKMPGTSTGKDAQILLEKGILRGASLEFSVEKSRFDGDMEIIERGKVYGIGLVDRPAYPDSVIKSMRSLRPRAIELPPPFFVV